jgi:hypothetical protein
MVSFFCPEIKYTSIQGQILETLHKHYTEYKNSFSFAVNLNAEVDSLSKDLQGLNSRIAVGHDDMIELEHHSRS